MYCNGFINKMKNIINLINSENILFEPVHTIDVKL